ncbi:hypothetical protein IEQ34_002494 [Dendrobium chrysotoxum]|uniref:Expansin-like EG45 domain-containing protein n=1 Tax=Dendrobium chrysotoxum TaxID=161865 RepID=A0AAV7HNL5_DENCH|nr:hypothetical protein IEQ34_002494 [Dendrobium chrysotoxum]
MKVESFFVIAVLLCLTSIACTSDTGTASYYSEHYTPSACFGFADKGTDIASVNDDLWDDSQACGRRYQIICNTLVINEGGTNSCYQVREGELFKVVTVVDHCGDCNGTTMNLSKQVFQYMAPLDAVNIPISYERI